MKDPVPGLSRGLKVLKILNNGSEMSLNELLKSTNIPKSSMLRIIQTLQDHGYIARSTSGKAYYSEIRLISHTKENSFWEKKLAETLNSLADSTANTVEWYIPCQEGFMLINRSEPASTEIRIKAKTGFVRKLHDGCEMEAVTRVGAALRDENMFIPHSSWTYKPDGKRYQLSEKEATFIVKQARTKYYASEEFYNLNGIKRTACAILKNNKLRGILALAECYVPAQATKGKDRLELLLEKAATLCENSDIPFA